MQVLERDGYTQAQVEDALHAERRELSFRYELLDKTNRHRRWLTDVSNGVITYDYYRTIKRQATFAMKDDVQVDWASDRIRPWARVRMPDGGFVSWPQGIFLLTSPVRQISVLGLPMREVSAHDATLVLAEHRVDVRYGVPAGTNYIEVVRSLLFFAGITKVNLEPTDEVTPEPMEWDAGTPRIEIINDLLIQINYEELYFDEAGVAVARKWIEPHERPIDYRYALDGRSVTAQAMDDAYDFFDVPNKWTMVVSHPDLVISSTFVNDRPDLLTSTVNRGRVISRYIEGIEAPSKAALDELVLRQAIEDTQANHDITFGTSLMPFHGVNDTLMLDFPGTTQGRKFIEIGWTLPLIAGESMEHRVRRVVQL